MERKIIKIDEKKCNGCGKCATACHEGAIEIINGKAKLVSDSYCDGLGDCLPQCPTGAISFEQREADEYDEEAVKRRMKEQGVSHSCPHSAPKKITHSNNEQGDAHFKPTSMLENWPVQIKLAPVNASFYNGAKLLVAADCSAFAYGDFHNEFVKDRLVLIGCPKLDMIDYSKKLGAILSENDIKSITVVRMEVPCCGGIENAVKSAIKQSGKILPWSVVTISTDGKIIDRK